MRSHNKEHAGLRLPARPDAMSMTPPRVATDTKGDAMTGDGLDAMWGDAPPDDGPLPGCILLFTVTALVWLAVGLGVWAVIVR